MVVKIERGSKVTPNSKPTLICTVWTGKLYNQESFRAQMRSIWKTKKKFEIQKVGQNLYIIVSELKEDLESILEGKPWLFRKSFILFNRLSQEMERDQISLTSSPFWIKIDSHLPEFDKKDLMHAIGVTFEGVIRSEIRDTCCRLRISLDVRKPLRRGVQSSYTGGQEVLTGSSKEFEKKKQELKEIQENIEMMGEKDLLKQQENKFGIEEVVNIDNSKA
ncbi:hypothetical protein GOBAR_DD05458 [Gossypium barbadense]|nr:hypothetical protein GOBAR_DD05458 [Gossypium barbadense]